MAVTLERVGARVYLKDLSFNDKDRAKAALGMTGQNFDREKRAWWVGVAKLDAATKFVAELNAGPAAGDAGGAAKEPDSARVYAKVKYKGRTMYVVAESHGQGRCKVCPLMDGVGTWVDMADCDLERTYSPREYRGRTEYTTLGSLRSFVEKQKRLEADGAPQCAACGKRSNDLVHDLEDGCMKCPGCADMPE